MKDPDIRKILRNSLLREFYQDGISKVVDELSVGQADVIVDIAVINGHLHGFEIKSRHDSLDRLPGQ